ncbi:DUF3488 and transglutaminase-like domain-containing protein [Blastococcus sp. TF02A-30]|uniref:DUF3488 and transglutaminase-like domain-containing protein n=1 Tax=Blastococcus sp. TF02A-30 TaxID=2250580 RepID=UPI000DE945C7|nr:DUF3488 and transglutaminase-like domain-containing protein [Blastococcus sp. TF02A-30]RBY85572.1 transglutaminase domain-containing protein [Blastococcus sp. TF02A-30]
MRPDLRTALGAAAATVLGSLALTPVFSSAAWFRPVFLAVVVVAGTGIALRAAGRAGWARLAAGRPVPRRVAALGAVAVPLVQVGALVLLLTSRWTPEPALWGVLPTSASVPDLLTVLGEGAAETREQATPAIPLPGLVALTTLFVGLVAVVVDVVTVPGRRVALAGAALLGLFAVPLVTITGGIGVVALAGPAAGLAVLLWTDQRRRLDDQPRAGAARLTSGGGPAFRIGLVALLTALVAGAFVPTLAEGSLATGLGGAGGSSTGTSLDPVAAMAGELTRPEPIDLLRLRTSVADPGYLRSVTIDSYDVEEGWSLSNLDGQVSVLESRALAPLPRQQAGREVTAVVEVLEHDDRFLPLPTSPLSVELGGDDADWRFDPSTGTVFGRGVTTADRSYRVTAAEPRPSADLLASSPPVGDGSPVRERYTALPELDPRVTALVAELVGAAEGPYARVRSILDFLTDRDNGFSYSLATDPGTSGDDLVDFLDERRGYCEQYAGAMAVMVRAAGVPARVALGYTAGTVQDDGSRVITTDDAHAWVEVYFAGLGWVPFDPTPIDVDRRAALPWAPRVEVEETPETPLDVPEPVAPEPAPTAPRNLDEDPLATGPLSGGGSSGAGRWLPWTGAVLGAAALLGLPAAARAGLRRRRLADGSPGALWDELAATAADLGLPRDPAWTPRETAAALATAAPEGPARAAIGQLARAEERASYGPASATDGGAGLAEALRAARRGLAHRAGRRARLRALLWPASLPAAVRAGVVTWWRTRRPATRPA